MSHIKLRKINMLQKGLHSRIAIFLTLSLFSSILIISCSKAKGPVYESGGEPSVSPEAGTFLEPGESVFPHKAGWAEPEKHGKAVYKDGVIKTSACAGTCHGENLEGGIGPSCKKCHELFPHDDGWENKDKHGAFVKANGSLKCATKCHGSDMNGGVSGIACANCHSVYPHSANFALPEGHGPYAAGEKKNDCILCHGADWKGGDTGASCLDCHEQIYPHSDGWSKKENHGTYVTANSKEACATKCHGSDLAGGLSGVSCDACHTLWPSEHKKGDWKSLAHGKKFLGLGKGACLGCHGDDWKGGSSGKSCFTCHDSLPHHDDDGWESSGHGKYAVVLNGDYTGCKKCHGENLEGVPSAETGIPDVPACSECHESYPYKHTAPWKTTFAGHPAQLLAAAKKDPQFLAECQKCHGDKLDGGGSGKSCYACHKTYPHLEGWNTSHGDYYIANEKDKPAKTCATANCHGLNLKGNPENVAVGQKLVLGCEDCHLKYPHPADWKHGLADPTLKKCKTCHGDDLKGKGKAVSCYSEDVKCHKSFPDPHRESPYETADADWKTLNGHSKYTAKTDENGKITVNIETCKVCHGSAFTGGGVGSNIKLSCYACHKSYPHPPTTLYQYDANGVKYFPYTDPAKWKSFDGGHGLFLAYKAKKAGKKASELAKLNPGGVGCANCHGDDFDGGISGKSCRTSTCHPSYPHAYDGTWKQNVADPTTTHGAYLLQGLATPKDIYKKIQNEKCLNNYCHGSEGVSSWNAPTCASCHATFPNSHQAADWAEKNAHGSTAMANIEECKTCHGADLAGGNVNKPCSDCHAVIEAHFDTENWEKVAHGAEVLEADNNGDGIEQFSSAAYSTKCQFCHGEIYPLDNKWPSEQAGTVDEPFICYNCHSSYPHNEYVDASGTKWSNWEFAHGWKYIWDNEHFGSDNNQSVIESCGGGTINYCHNGKRHAKTSKNKNLTSCGVLCHIPK